MTPLKDCNDQILSLQNKYLEYENTLHTEQSLARQQRDQINFKQMTSDFKGVGKAQYGSASAALTAAAGVQDAWVEQLHSASGRERVQRDPKTARCDGLGSIRIEGFFLSLAGSKENKFAFSHRRKKITQTKIEEMKTWSSFEAVVQRKMVANNYRDVMSGAVLSRVSSPGSPPTPVTPENVADGLQNMNLEDDSEQDTNGEYEPNLGSHLDIPLFTVENKRRIEKAEATAANQNRLYTISMVKFLQTLGITDFPVFGIVAEGPVGVVSCAWGENKDGVFVFSCLSLTRNSQHSMIFIESYYSTRRQTVAWIRHLYATWGTKLCDLPADDFP